MKDKQTNDFPETFYSFIEIQANTNEKYEYDHELDALVLDRFLYTSMVYPTNYGSILGTKAKDGDPLDVLVISAPIQRGCAIKCRAVGLLEMNDEEGVDHKILAVPVEKVDPSSASIRDIGDLPQHFKDRLKHFFEHYKELEKGKFVKLGAFKGKAEAIALIRESK
ncbi:MAG: inorganic diphosphatase [Candidatus Micrarchaeota archaeon]|nr:inorganic diphosphatase [Candidatus Micrarchaeota archaeon]